MVKSTLLFGALAAVSSYAHAKEIKVNEDKAQRLYDSGVVHNKLMASKQACRPADDVYNLSTNIL